jgi:hypothetical protein
MPSDNRERSFEDALAAHLRAGAKDIPRAECSDAETLAAYHEGSLPGDQVASLKTHITSCERCQQILTALEATDELAAPTANVAPQLAAAVKPAVHVLPARKRALWQWVAPAGAIAAALLVWVTVHENTPLIIPAKPPALNSSRAAKQEEEALKSLPPASRTLSPSGNSALSIQVSPDLHQTLPAAPAPKIAGSLRERSQALSKQKDVSNAAKRSAIPAAVDQFADASPNLDDSLHRKELSAPNLEAQNQTVMIQPDKAEAEDKIVNARRDAAAPKPPQPAPERSASATPAPSAPPPSAPRARVSTESAALSGGIAQQQEMAGMSRLKQSEVRLANSVAEVTISAPGEHVYWRVGLAGIIEFSPDAGKSWTVQPSGVISDLLAGSAPSEKVCWIVGRAGTLLRSTDGGTHWQKLRPPSQEDLHSVFAVDARQATVSSLNAKYQTTDGGVTWKKLPPE